MHRTISRLSVAALCFALLCGVAACGPDEATRQRAIAEEAERAERARVQAKAELDADQERFKKISTSLVDPNAPPAAEPRAAPEATVVAAESPQAPIPVVATPAENLVPTAAFKLLEQNVGALEHLEAEGAHCATMLRNYAQPDRTQQNGCLKFMSRQADYQSAVNAVDSLSKNDQFFRENEVAFGKAKQLMESLANAHEFAATRMRTLTGRAQP